MFAEMDLKENVKCSHNPHVAPLVEEYKSSALSEVFHTPEQFTILSSLDLFHITRSLLY